MMSYVGIAFPLSYEKHVFAMGRGYCVTDSVDLPESVESRLLSDVG